MGNHTELRLSPERARAIEEYARSFMGHEPGHDFEHIHRVRNWALQIARGEAYPGLDAVEAAALLHDIGVPHAKRRRDHGRVGAQMAKAFLDEGAFFPQEAADAICHAVEFHCTNRGGSGKLLDILRDADMMDMFGAVGIMRGIAFVADKPCYDPECIRGHLWGASARDFDQRIDNGLGIGDTVVDVLSFHISCFENLATNTARRFAQPMIQYMQSFIMQVESEVAGRE